MFYNRKSYIANERLLDSLQEAAKNSHEKTFKRVTKDYDGANEFVRAQYIGAKFREAGFNYPSSDAQIKKCVGIEKALQTLNTYGGRNFSQAYFNKFLNQFESSKQRLHDLNLTNGEMFKAEQDKQKAYEEIVKKRKEDFSDLFFASRGNNTPMKNTKNGSAGPGDDNDGDSDGGNGDGNNRRKQKRMEEFMKKEMKKYMIFAGKHDDIDDHNDDKDNISNKIRIPTPREVFEKNAYAERPNWIDPVSGEYRKGYDNIDSTFLRNQLNDSKKNALINSSVDTLRAGTNKSILRNNPAVRRRITDFVDKKEEKRASFNVTQFGEPIIAEGENQQMKPELTLGSVLSSSRNKIESDSIGDDYDWDQLTTVYERGDNFVDGDDGGNNAIEGREQQNGEESDSGNSTSASSRGDFLLPDEIKSSQQPLDVGQTGESSSGSEGGRLAIRSGGVSKIIENMNGLGYDDDQVGEFLTNLEMNYDEFQGLHLDEQISEITKVLDEIGHAGGSDPTYSDFSAEENRQLIKQKRIRKETGATSNLMSDEFAKEKNLHTLTTLSLKISKPTVERKVKPSDPGEVDDPYRSLMIINSSSPPPPPPPGGGAIVMDTEGDEKFQENRQEYLRGFDSRLNQFIGNTPFQTENSIALNNFLRQVMVEDPKEIVANNRRNEEERQLRENLRENFNPNNTSTKDAVSYDQVNPTAVSSHSELIFEKKLIRDTDDIEILVDDTSNINGKPLIGKIVENALKEVKDNEESTIGGLLGNTNGTNSFTNFTSNDYYKLCGVSDEENFQSLLNEKIDSDDSRNINIFNDQTKLNFLPGEKRPNMTFPPLSILPTNNEHQLIGVKPLFGGSLDTDNNIIDEETPATMVTMEVDASLLNTSEQSVITDTTVAEVNVLEEDQRNGNYAARMRQMQTTRDKAYYVVQMLLKDAILCGRLDQTMLANHEVVKICQVLFHVIEILLNKQSSYFENYQAKYLELINVDTIEDSSHGYFTVLNNGVYALNLFEVSRNVFNFKMEPITESQFRSASNDETPNLRTFKHFLYFVMRENQIRDVDSIIVFRSESRFRQATIIRYQSLDPQMRTKNFFLLLDNYFLQLHVSGNTSIVDPMKFNNVLESDLHRRFNALVLDFMAHTNATMEQLLARSPLALLLTENETRMQNNRALSYRKSLIPLIRNLNNSNPQSDFEINSDRWDMLFHGRENANHHGTMNNDTPPSGATLNRLINSFRDSRFAVGSARNVGPIMEGGQWAQIEPTMLLDILVNAFIEHQVIPPLRGNYTQGLSNFFSVLMADPIQQMFVKHLKVMYRRGWRKENLARQAAYAFVEHYVALVLLIVQRALLQNDASLSTTVSYASSIERFSPMVKLQDVLRELIVAFDPLSYIVDELANRESHEQRYLYHFKRYSEHVSEIIASYELWLQEEVDGYRINVNMTRNELFLRIISAGGYDESRANYLEGIQTNVAESDEVTMKTQPTVPINANTQVDPQGLEMKQIDITITNTGTQTMPLPKAQVTQPIEVRNEPLDDRTKVNVDASHPEVRNMDNRTLMNAIRSIVQKELDLKINKVVVPERNENISSSTKKYTAYATPSLLSESDIGEDVDQETLLYNVEIQPFDSASQVALQEINHNDTESLNTIDYNAPGALVYETSSTNISGKELQPASKKSTLLTIAEPTVLTTIGQNVDRVLHDNKVVSNVTEEYDVPNNRLISSELNERIRNTISSDYDDEEISVPSILTNTDSGKSNIPEQSLSNIQKDQFSAAKEIEDVNSVIDNTIKKIAKLSESQVSAKATRKDKVKISKIRREEARRKSHNEMLINKRRGITLRKSAIPPYNTVADHPDYTKKEKERLEKGIEENQQKLTALEERNLIENKLSAKEKDEKNKIRTVAIPKKKKAIKRKLLTTVAGGSKNRFLQKSKLQRLQAIKRLHDKQLAGRKIKIPKKQHDEKKAMEQINDTLDRLERNERNMPEVLVTKPMSEDSPFFRQGKLSTYSTNAGVLKKKGNKKSQYDREETDSFFSKSSTKLSKVSNSKKGKKHNTKLN